MKATTALKQKLETMEQASSSRRSEQRTEARLRADKLVAIKRRRQEKEDARERTQEMMLFIGTLLKKQ
ncbi:hypothetical protein PHYSODRAFT_288792 [Phytophthora sojae]|uniref:Uncharacterized protein n=1 Tax=Phytophthora sojae (strain P6497) TaxID=1094619 RepID=G5A811_PHYSP|nr:hypothetical protein PHYSODRAFT_288792 [Phytophthora sojae]EGZ08037.1 hypothetical protein PHYSODRAFT_288792 [Phytophthora sojae]|eukprot:XP_009536209.1 hypothetical protein PHYSODRAFT_288792 [Phytophthora sojae]